MLLVQKISNSKFLCLIIDYSLSWKSHIVQMMSKMNTECFVIRAIQPIMSPEYLRIVYFEYVHSMMSCVIIFGENHP
jgi:hypothetical protein